MTFYSGLSVLWAIAYSYVTKSAVQLADIRCSAEIIKPQDKPIKQVALVFEKKSVKFLK